MRDLIGLNWRSVGRGLYYGSAIGTAQVLATLLDQWWTTGGLVSRSRW